MAQVIYQNEVDLNLKPTALYEFEYVVAGPSFTAYFDDNTTPDNIHLASFEVTNSQGTKRWINYKIHDGRTTTHIVDANTIRYNGVHEGIDVKYEVLEDRMKEYIYVDSVDNYVDIVFTIKSEGCTWEAKDGAIVFYDVDTNEQLWVIEKPFVVGQDANVSIYESAPQDGYPTFTLSVENPTSLTYPLVIDPTTINTSIYDWAPVIWSSAYNSYVAFSTATLYGGQANYIYYQTSTNGTSWSSKTQFDSMWAGDRPGATSFLGRAVMFYPTTSGLKCWKQTSATSGTTMTVDSSVHLTEYHISFDALTGTMYIGGPAKSGYNSLTDRYVILSTTDLVTWTKVVQVTGLGAGNNYSPHGFWLGTDGYFHASYYQSNTVWNHYRFDTSSTYTNLGTMTIPHMKGFYRFTDGTILSYSTSEIFIDDVVRYTDASELYIPDVSTESRLTFLRRWGTGDNANAYQMVTYDRPSDVILTSAEISLTGAKTYFGASNHPGATPLRIGNGRANFGGAYNSSSYYDYTVYPYDGRAFGGAHSGNVGENVIEPTFIDTFDNLVYLPTRSNSAVSSGFLILKGGTSSGVLYGNNTVGISNGTTSVTLNSTDTSLNTVYSTNTPAIYISTIQAANYTSGYLNTYSVVVTAGGQQVYSGSYSTSTSGDQVFATVNKAIYLTPQNPNITVTITRTAGVGSGISRNASSGQPRAWVNGIKLSANTLQGQVVSAYRDIPADKNRVSVSFGYTYLTANIISEVSFNTDETVWIPANEWVEIPQGATQVRYRATIAASAATNFGILTDNYIGFTHIGPVGTPGESFMDSTERILDRSFSNLPMNIRVLCSESITLPFLERTLAADSANLTANERILMGGLDNLTTNERTLTNDVSMLDANVRVTEPGMDLLTANEFTILPEFENLTGIETVWAPESSVVDMNEYIIATGERPYVEDVLYTDDITTGTKVSTAVDGNGYIILDPTGGDAPGTYALATPTAAIASSAYSTTFDADRAMDKNNDTAWWSKTTDNNPWIRFDIGSVKYTKSIDVWLSAALPQTFDVYGSVDGVNYTYLASRAITSSDASKWVTIEYPEAKYRYIRLNWTLKQSFTSFNEIKINVASLVYQIPGTYADVKPASASASASYPGQPASNAIDGDTNTGWYGNTFKGAVDNITFTLAEEMFSNGFRVYGATSRVPFTFTLLTSVDGTNWTNHGSMSVSKEGWNTFLYTERRVRYIQMQKVGFGGVANYGNVFEVNAIAAPVLPVYAKDGHRTSPVYTYPEVKNVYTSSITWSADTPAGTSVTVFTSVDGGTVWTQVENGGSIPGLVTGGNVRFKHVLHSDVRGYTPKILSMKFMVNGITIDTPHLVEKVVIAEEATLSMRENPSYPGFDTLPANENIWIGDRLTSIERTLAPQYATLPMRENPIVYHSSRLSTKEVVIGTGSSILNMREKPVDDDMDSVGMVEVTKAPDASHLSTKVRVLAPTYSLLNVRETAIESTGANLSMNERIQRPGSKLLVSTEYVKRAGSKDLTLKERPVIGGSSKLNVSERSIVSTSSMLPIHEYVEAHEFSTLLMREVSGTRDTSYLGMVEKPVDEGMTSINVPERVVIGGMDTLNVSLNVYFEGSSLLPIHERSIISTSGSLTADERVVQDASISIPVSERITVSNSSVIDINEFTFGSGSAKLKVRERVQADTVGFIDVYEFVDSDTIDIIKMHEYVSNESLNVLVRKAIYKRLTQ